ncbi:MAG: hypothetical protein M1830_000476 [Pleopsidium flavum]|nr:MAG: hypothetical protein M1830_000476 [Pleopsidium flavum]
MPTDSATAKFLYTIIKQLDLKSIDWNIVALQLDITNGHAARMRFSRFKQHMEGIPISPRKPRISASRPAKKPKLDKADVKKCAQGDTNGKADDAETNVAPRVKTEPVEASIASLPQARSSAGSGAAAEQIGALSLGPKEVQVPEPAFQLAQRRDFGPFGGSFPPVDLSLERPKEVMVKLEPSWED